MITIYLDNLRTTKPKKPPKKPRGPKTKPLKLPGLAPVNKKDPRDLLGEVSFLITKNLKIKICKKLIEAGIVKKLMPAKVDDLIGEPDNLGCIYERQMKRMPDPSYSQIRQVKTKYLTRKINKK